MEWGPWLIHDGKGCPCLGAMVEVVEVYHGPRVLIAGSDFDGTENWSGSSWHWALIPCCPLGDLWDPILRYRIRKPRGLTMLEDLIADLPAPVGPKVEA